MIQEQAMPDHSRKAEEAVHRESAAEFYYRAALYYGPACGVLHSNTPRKLDLYKRLVHCCKEGKSIRRRSRAPPAND
jgi:hypothetical protein